MLIKPFDPGESALNGPCYHPGPHHPNCDFYTLWYLDITMVRITVSLLHIGGVTCLK